MKGLRGSFLGLTYNNIHSSLLGITRIIPDDSHEERLVPTFKEQSAWTGNSDGSYYFGATHQKREFVINIAFEEMTEKQKRQINALWNDREIHELIFDEYPYKVYSAKITGNSTLKQIAHDKMIDGKMERVYSGEGSFVFTCYFPYARSRYEYLEDYISNNIHEWVSIQDENRTKILEADAKLEQEYMLSAGGITYDLIGRESDTINAKLIFEKGDEVGQWNEDYFWPYRDANQSTTAIRERVMKVDAEPEMQPDGVIKPEDRDKIYKFADDLESYSGRLENPSTILTYEEYIAINHDKAWIDYWKEYWDGKYKASFSVTNLDINTFFNNMDEWKDSIKLPSRANYGFVEEGKLKLNNVGDIPVPFRLWIRMPEKGCRFDKISLKLYEGSNENPTHTIALDHVEYKNIYGAKEEQYLIFDMEKNSIESFNGAAAQTGEMYNQYLSAKDGYDKFFLLPVGECSLELTATDNTGAIKPEIYKIEFHYQFY